MMMRDDACDRREHGQKQQRNPAENKGPRHIVRIGLVIAVRPWDRAKAVVKQKLNEAHSLLAVHATAYIVRCRIEFRGEARHDGIKKP